MAKSEILGIGDLGKAFREVKQGMEARTGRAMVVAAGGVLKRRAKSIAIANGSRRTGAMVKNIVIKRERDAPPNTEQYHLGVRHGRDLTRKQKGAGKRVAINGAGRLVVRYVDDPYYWRWVEQGHKVVPREPVEDGRTTFKQRLRNGKVVIRSREYSGASLRARRRAASGSVDAKPFIAPALEQGRQEAIEAMAARLQREHEKASKK